MGVQVGEGGGSLATSKTSEVGGMATARPRRLKRPIMEGRIGERLFRVCMGERKSFLAGWMV